MSYGDKPFGLRDVKVVPAGGGSAVDFPAAQKLKVTPIFKSGELEGDDVLKSVVSRISGAEWELEAGGISLAAYAALTGIATSASGITPNESTTMTISAGTAMPYIKVYGKSLGDGADDVHVLLFKAKVTELDGDFADGEFFVTSCKGKAVDDGVNGVMDIVQNETAADLPST